MALAVGFTLLYLSTPTRHYTFDAVAYAHQIDRFGHDGRPGWLFHAHHLLFNAAGWGVWVALQELGLRVSSLEALQVMNAALGGLGVGLFALALAGATDRPLLAVTLAALFGVSHGYWTCATDGRVNIPGLVGVLAAFCAALRWVESGSRWWALASGALTGVAILLHQSHVLFVPVLALAALLARAPRRGRLGSGFMAALGAAVVVAGAYVTVAVAVKGIRDLESLQAWLWQYGADGRWWSLDWRSNLPLSAAALARAAWPIPGLEAGEARGQELLLLGGAPGWLLWVGGVLLLVRLPALLRRHGAALLLCGAWFGVYAAFFTIWNPGYFPFWLSQMAAAWMAVGLIAAELLPGGQAWWPAWPRARGRRSVFSARPMPRGLRQPLGRQASLAASSRSHAHLLNGTARLRGTRLRRIGRLLETRRGSGDGVSAVPPGLSRCWARVPTLKRGANIVPSLRDGASVDQPGSRRAAASRLFSCIDARIMFGGRLNSALRQDAVQRLLRWASVSGRFAVGVAAGVLGVALTFTLFLRTYGEAIRPRMVAEANPYLQVAEEVRAATQPGDLVLATGTGWLAQGEVYIPYFSDRPLLALQAVLKRQGGDKEAAFDHLRDAMERCWASGGGVYILDEALASREAYEVLLERYALSREEARQFFEAYSPRPVLQAGVHSVWRLSPLPAERVPAPDVHSLRGYSRLENGGTASGKEGDSDEGAPGAEGDRPVSANGALARQASG